MWRRARFLRDTYTPPAWPRPGWLIGRRWCRYKVPLLTRDEELALLEDYKSVLEEEVERLRRELKDIEDRLEELRRTRG